MMMTTKSLPPKTNKHRAMHFCVFMSSPRAVQTLLEYSFAIILHQPSLHPLPRPPLPVWLCGCSTLALCLSKRFTVSFSYHSYSLSLQSRDMGENWPWQRRAVMVKMRHSILWERVSWLPLLLSSLLWLIRLIRWQWFCGLTCSNCDDPDGQCKDPACFYMRNSPWRNLWSVYNMFLELMVMSYRWSTNYHTKKMGVELSNALKWDDLLC